MRSGDGDAHGDARSMTRRAVLDTHVVRRDLLLAAGAGSLLGGHVGDWIWLAVKRGLVVSIGASEGEFVVVDGTTREESDQRVELWGAPSHSDQRPRLRGKRDCLSSS